MLIFNGPPPKMNTKWEGMDHQYVKPNIYEDHLRQKECDEMVEKARKSMYEEMCRTMREQRPNPFTPDGRRPYRYPGGARSDKFQLQEFIRQYERTKQQSDKQSVPVPVQPERVEVQPPAEKPMGRVLEID